MLLNIKVKIIVIDNPDINNCANQVVTITNVIPTSGCNKSNGNTKHILINDINIPWNFLFLYCSAINHAVNIVITGFKNSEGCNENPKIFIHLLAPFISVPNSIVHIINTIKKITK